MGSARALASAKYDSVFFLILLNHGPKRFLSNMYKIGEKKTVIYKNIFLRPPTIFTTPPKKPGAAWIKN